MTKFKVCGATLNQIPLDWENNLSNIKEAILRARNENVKILNLPELCITGYGCEDMFLSEWVPDKALKCLHSLLPLTKSITVIVGLPFSYDNGLFNCSAILRNQEILGIYAKRHLAREGVHYEPRWFNSWPAEKVEYHTLWDKTIPIGDLSIEIEGIKVGFEICEDAWRPDRPACKYENRSIDLILNPSASHFAFGKAAFRENLVVESSKQFDCFYLYTNLLGNESGRMIFDGDIILAGRGMLIQRNKRLSFENINLLVEEIDFERKTTKSTPLMEDFKSQNEEFASVASLALFDYFRKSRSKGFVLSLSGGADSSCCAILVSEMVRRGIKQLGQDGFISKLGIDANVGTKSAKEIVQKILFTAYQGTKNSSVKTLDSATELANSLGARFFNWSIDEEVNLYTQTIEKALGKHLTWENDDITLQNIQARARSPIIWMIANIQNAILLTTSNRSEGDVGYATMDGDTSGSLAPIAAIDKPFILQWLQWAEEELGYDELHRVNSLIPTAELRPTGQDQTDEKDLMPYAIMVRIERLAIKEKMSPRQTLDLLAEQTPNLRKELGGYVKKFFGLWAKNQWKRERIAPSFHYDDFNVDPRSWMRFPILSSGFKEELKELEG
ncbi:MAG: NAD(+) synthase [Bacteroidetes bacterium]|nr:NAD(+) synthase [Bacteroidota bacterium]MDA1119032.1 NAD(+) synthase [Bacteroidota bacterium]